MRNQRKGERSRVTRGEGVSRKWGRARTGDDLIKKEEREEGKKKIRKKEKGKEPSREALLLTSQGHRKAQGPAAAGPRG